MCQTLLTYTPSLLLGIFSSSPYRKGLVIVLKSSDNISLLCLDSSIWQKRRTVIYVLFSFYIYQSYCFQNVSSDGFMKTRYSLGALFHCETATKFNGPRAGHSEQTRATKTNTKTKQTKKSKKRKNKRGRSDTVLFVFTKRKSKTLEIH